MTVSLLVLPPQVLTRMRNMMSFSVNFRVLSLNALSSKLQKVYRLHCSTHKMLWKTRLAILY